VIFEVESIPPIIRIHESLHGVEDVPQLAEWPLGRLTAEYPCWAVINVNASY
jgi:hypothetical protein